MGPNQINYVIAMGASVLGFMIDGYGDSKIESAANTHVSSLWY